MAMKDYLDRIDINPKILLGKPVIKGTRIPVYVILDLIAEGCSIKEILEYYPSLKKRRHYCCYKIWCRCCEI